MSWQLSEVVAQGRGRDRGPGHAGRAVVVKKAGEADGVRRPSRLGVGATPLISNLRSFPTRF